MANLNVVRTCIKYIIFGDRVGHVLNEPIHSTGSSKNFECHMLNHRPKSADVIIQYQLDRYSVFSILEQMSSTSKLVSLWTHSDWEDLSLEIGFEEAAGEHFVSLLSIIIAMSWCLNFCWNDQVPCLWELLTYWAVWTCSTHELKIK